MMKTKINLKKVVEGFLFASTVPLSAEAISKMFLEEEEKPSLGEIRQVLAKLQTEYTTRGIILAEVATGYRFQVADFVVPYISKSQEEKPSRYSRALLETLALIAYRQPITRGEIEDIRGVVVSTHIIKTLDEHEWIKVVGHKEVPGKPALYATTKYFLDHFGLKSLNELPPLAELKNLEGFADQALLKEDSVGSETQAEQNPTEVENDVEKLEEITEEITEEIDEQEEQEIIAVELPELCSVEE